MLLPTLLILSTQCILCTATALAQSRSAPPKISAEAKKLSVFVGKWTAEGEIKPGPMGPGGEMLITRSCNWTYDGIGVLCHEIDTIPGVGKVSHVILMSYDAHTSDYVLFNASNMGHIRICRGMVSGDVWTWTGEHTMGSQRMQLRLTQKWTSKDSFDFKDEGGTDANSMTVTTDGKGTRVRTPAGKALRNKSSAATISHPAGLH
jgi:uncharacterized protein DUF1579